MNSRTLVSYTLNTGPGLPALNMEAGRVRNVILDVPFVVSTKDDVSDLRQLVGEAVMPGGWTREDYNHYVAIISWQRLEDPEAEA